MTTKGKKRDNKTEPTPAPAARKPAKTPTKAHKGGKSSAAQKPTTSAAKRKPREKQPIATPEPDVVPPVAEEVIAAPPPADEIVTPLVTPAPTASAPKSKKREKQPAPIPDVIPQTTDGAAVNDNFRIGCAIWAYDGWAEIFFPKGTPKDKRLHTYAQRLTAVEINSTFYAVPAVPVVKKWAEEVPDNFRFCPKFPKAITHTAQLVNVDAQTATFIGTMRVLGSKLGPLMLQLPPSFGPLRLPILQKYLQGLPTDLEIAVEVRHPEWFTEANAAKLDKVLAETNTARVVFDVRPAHDSPDPNSAQERKPDVPLVPVATRPYVVVRYIASPVPEENTPFFEEWTPRLAQWLSEDRRIYFFVHCPVEERSPDFAREVFQRLSAVTPLPALPWDVIDAPKPITTAPLAIEAPDDVQPEPPAPITEPPQAELAEPESAAPAPIPLIEPESLEAPVEEPKPVKQPKGKKRKAEENQDEEEESGDKPVQLTLF